jgi:hypothetical protein
MDFHSLYLTAQPDAEGGLPFLPSYVMHDGWLVAGLYPQRVMGHILRVKEDYPVWKPSPVLVETLARLEQQHATAKVLAVMESDPRGSLKSYLGLAPALGGALHMGGPKYFDPAMLPNAHNVCRPLFPNVTVILDDGESIRAECFISFPAPSGFTNLAGCYLLGNLGALGFQSVEVSHSSPVMPAESAAWQAFGNVQPAHVVAGTTQGLAAATGSATGTTAGAVAEILAQCKPMGVPAIQAADCCPKPVPIEKPTARTSLPVPIVGHPSAKMHPAPNPSYLQPMSGDGTFPLPRELHGKIPAAATLPPPLLPAPPHPQPVLPASYGGSPPPLPPTMPALSVEGKYTPPSFSRTPVMPPTLSAPGKLVVKVYPVSDLFAPAHRHPAEEPAGTLIKHVMMIEPQSWSHNVGGEAAYLQATGTLTVRQTLEAHEQIQRFLEDLRAKVQRPRSPIPIPPSAVYPVPPSHPVYPGAAPGTQ